MITVIEVVLGLGIVALSIAALLLIGSPLLLLIMELEWRWLTFVDDRLHIIRK